MQLDLAPRSRDGGTVPSTASCQLGQWSPCARRGGLRSLGSGTAPPPSWQPRRPSKAAPQPRRARSMPRPRPTMVGRAKRCKWVVATRTHHVLEASLMPMYFGLLAALASAVLCSTHSASAAAATVTAAGATESPDGLRGHIRGASSTCPPCLCPPEDTTTPAAAGRGGAGPPTTAHRRAPDQMERLLLPIRALATAPDLANATLAAHPSAGRQLLDIRTVAATLLTAAGASGDSGAAGLLQLAAIAADPLFAAHLSAMFLRYSASSPGAKGSGVWAQEGPELAAATANRSVSAPAGHRSLGPTGLPPAATAPTVPPPTATKATQQGAPVQRASALVGNECAGASACTPTSRAHSSKVTSHTRTIPIAGSRPDKGARTARRPNQLRHTAKMSTHCHSPPARPWGSLLKRRLIQTDVTQQSIQWAQLCWIYSSNSPKRNLRAQMVNTCSLRVSFSIPGIHL